MSVYSKDVKIFNFSYLRTEVLLITLNPSTTMETIWIKTEPKSDDVDVKPQILETDVAKDVSIPHFLAFSHDYSSIWFVSWRKYFHNDVDDHDSIFA